MRTTVVVIGIVVALAVGYLIGREHTRYRAEMERHGLETSLLEVRQAHTKAKTDHEEWISHKEREVQAIVAEVQNAEDQLQSVVQLAVGFLQRVRDQELAFEEAMVDLYKTAKPSEYRAGREKLLGEFQAWLVDLNQAYEDEVESKLADVLVSFRK